MILRYFKALSNKQYTRYVYNSISGSTTQTVTYTTIVNGPAGAVVTFKLTTFNHSNPGAVYKCNGLTYILNDTFNVTLDGSGATTLTQFLDVGTSTPGNGANTILTITAVSIGLVGAANTAGMSKTV